MMGLIGFTTGVIGFLLHQLIEKIADVKWDITQQYIQVGMLVCPQDDYVSPENCSTWRYLDLNISSTIFTISSSVESMQKFDH